MTDLEKIKEKLKQKSKPTKNRKAGKQRKIHINETYSFSCRLGLPVTKGLGSILWLTVEDWINKHPALLYNHVYRHHIYKIKQVKLGKDEAIALIEQLKITHPDLYEEWLTRRLRNTKYIRDNRQKELYRVTPRRGTSTDTPPVDEN